MILNHEEIKLLDYSRMANGIFNLSFKDSKLQMLNSATKRDVTIGRLDSLKFIKKMNIRNIENGDSMIKLPMEQYNVFNIYKEKFHLLKDLTYIDMGTFKKVQQFIDIYYGFLKRYMIVDKSPNIDTLEKLMSFLAVPNAHIRIGANESKHIVQDSHIFLNVISDGKTQQFMPAFSIRLPIKDFYVIRLLMFPKNDKEYYYIISKPAGKGAVLRYYMVNNIEEYTKFIETTIYDNLFYKAEFEELFGIKNKEEIMPEHFDLYGMYKI
jgi:hypothetical protein